ncbi:MAG: PilZ domain-containing protein [Elusimicrobia bacterium]|nr:PilZ domain-containing protein [Elusimicrobiota bacterium]
MGALNPLQDRRAFRRFPVMVQVAKPVEVRVENQGAGGGGEVDGLPGVLVDLSAGGMSLVTFRRMDPDPSYLFCLDLAGTHHLQIEGRIVRAHRKGETYLLGVKFSSAQPAWRQRLVQFADAYLACEHKLAAGMQHVCFPECAYYALCEKEAKEPFGYAQGRPFGNAHR